MAGGSMKVIIGSLAANFGIAVAKGIAAFFTGSGSMLAEAIHSSADCMNQVLLVVGAKQAEKPPSASHPMGHGRAAYFWSFLVALMIFFGGGVFSIREGWHKVEHPEPVTKVWVGLGVLIVALILETGATIQAAKAINEKRGEHPFFKFLSLTTDADLIVLFAENAAAVIGLVLALIALAMAAVTGDGRWDGYGSIVIGVLLTGVAFFLAKEVKSLLEGERADPNIEREFRAEAANYDTFIEVVRVLTIQQGPGQVMVAAKLKCKPDVTSGELMETINEFEAAVRKRCPQIKWQFIEPDTKD